MKQENESALSVPNGGRVRHSPMTAVPPVITETRNKISLANFNSCSILYTLTQTIRVTLLMISVSKVVLHHGEIY
jgi:hypothetical protein